MSRVNKIMMKSLMGWGVSLGIIGSSILGSLTITSKALALPTEQILQKLNPVPVFTIADEKGAPLIASNKDESKAAFVFISHQDANAFIADLKTKNPDLAQKVKVVTVPLGVVYELAKENKNEINFAYVPNKTAIESAKTVLSESDLEYQGGVPLFVAKGGEENEYLTIENKTDDKTRQIIPFFFEKPQLEKMVEQLKQQNPDLAATVSIEVIPLERIIATLHSSDDEKLNNIELMPSIESLKFVQQAISQQTEGEKK